MICIDRAGGLPFVGTANLLSVCGLQQDRKVCCARSGRIWGCEATRNGSSPPITVRGGAPSRSSVSLSG